MESVDCFLGELVLPLTEVGSGDAESSAFGEIEAELGEAVLDLGGLDVSLWLGLFAGFSGGDVTVELTSSTGAGLLRSWI
jgi:hypothetical protein